MSNTPEVTHFARGNVKPQCIDSLIGSARVHFPQMKCAIGRFIVISYCSVKSKVDDNLAKRSLYRDSPLPLLLGAGFFPTSLPRAPKPACLHFKCFVQQERLDLCLQAKTWKIPVCLFLYWNYKGE